MHNMAALSVIWYEPGMEQEWDESVWQSRNGTIFHSHRFISCHPPGRFEDCSLLFRHGNEVTAVFPAAIQLREGQFLCDGF
jgi:hypothetical protein